MISDLLDESYVVSAVASNCGKFPLPKNICTLFLL